MCNELFDVKDLNNIKLLVEYEGNGDSGGITGVYANASSCQSKKIR